MTDLQFEKQKNVNDEKQKNVNDDRRRKLDTGDTMVMEDTNSNSTVDADRPDQAQGNSWE